MIATGVANPTELAVLAQVLDEYCLEAGIPATGIAREEAARHVLDLFNQGIGDRDRLIEALRSSHRIAEREGA